MVILFDCVAELRGIAVTSRLFLAAHNLSRRNKRLHKLLRAAKALRKPNTQRMRRRNSLASFLIIRDQLTVLATTAISSIVERVRHALGSIDIRTLATVRFRIGNPDSCKLGIARTAQE